MSYLDQTSRKRPIAIAAVAALHLGLGYAIVTGLAYTVIRFVPPITTADILSDPPPPPEHEMPPPQRATHEDRLVPTQPPVVDVVTGDIGHVDVVPADVSPKVAASDGPPEQAPTPPRPSLARAAEPASARAGWVTTDDYPPQALRDEAVGVVGIDVLVGADGRVQGCTVTRSSGNASLDDATCRTYARRARFRAALDADGKPIASHRADRVRWELPQ